MDFSQIGKLKENFQDDKRTSGRGPLSVPPFVSLVLPMEEPIDIESTEETTCRSVFSLSESPRRQIQ
jgi:hypothetical protein